ncbi:MAG: HU family DNA-binding protein [Marinosulfonomonas sp.]|nr:HU family DNA-binding protein [Marinosulfonomonas sp.]
MATTTRRKPTSIKKKAPAKRAAGKPASAPAATAKAPVAPAAKAPVTAVAGPPVLRKKELIERVVARSGIKKKDAKPTIEAMLAVLGEALASGEELNLQPLGKVMVKRVKEQPNAKVMVCRIRQRKADAPSTVVNIGAKT